MEIDVIMLTNTKDDSFYKMTKETIESLLNSETEHNFNIILVESNNNSEYRYDYPNLKLIKSNLTEFNYNTSLNIGLDHSKNHWIIFSNNDIIYTKGWFSEIINTKEFKDNELVSFSPFNPNANKNDRIVNGQNVYLGYRIYYEVCGWCIFTNKSVLEKIGGRFDERFPFWYQDNDYSILIQRAGIPHFLVTTSIAYHLEGQSHKLLGDKENDMTHNMIHTFIDKWKNILK
jgi:GT2 family glycosyltransferase